MERGDGMGGVPLRVERRRLRSSNSRREEGEGGEGSWSSASVWER